jgi:hypothetical protein
MRRKTRTDKLMFWFGESLREMGTLLMTFGALDAMFVDQKLFAHLQSQVSKILIFGMATLVAGILLQYFNDTEDVSRL